MFPLSESIFAFNGDVSVLIQMVGLTGRPGGLILLKWEQGWLGFRGFELQEVHCLGVHWPSFLLCLLTVVEFPEVLLFYF